MRRCKLSRSQALKLSQVPSDDLRRGGSFCSGADDAFGRVGVSVSAAGDTAKVTAPRVSAKSTSVTTVDAHYIIDAGVLLADQPSYLCVPLGRLGISSTDEVIAVNSSCECTEPSIVVYRETQSQLARALRVDILPEPKASDSESVPASLAVEVTLELAGGRSTTATIQFLHTTLVDADVTNADVVDADGGVTP